MNLIIGKIFFHDEMLKILRHLRVGNPKAGSGAHVFPSPVRTLESFVDEEDLDVNPRRPFQSKSVRQRRRRNVMKRIYGSSYDHDADDYK